MNARTGLGALVLSALSLPALAQQPPFEAEIDCDGVVTPPAQVPYLLEFENRTLQTIPLDVTIRLTLPTGNSLTLREASLTLRPNQDRNFNFALNLPDSAPSGRYQMSIIATSPSLTTFDTCSFHAS
jgi:hypothetical protein